MLEFKFDTQLLIEGTDLDEDEIYDYFKNEAESDSLEDAITALGGDYEEMEIRLVRMKFLSEVAN